MMYQSKNYIEKPISLLSFDSLGHALVRQQGINFIKQVPKPLSIVTIAGPYRTGKSFLLNSIISAKNSFQVGSTTKSCTKGLWVWGKPILSVDQYGKITNILVIDTQGFGSCQQNHDKRIIILALLLSTCFIYNSKGLIDKDSLNDLQYVIKQTKKIKRQFCLDSVTDFHWILRDFQFQLVNQLGLQISEDQYMQKCLNQFSSSASEHRQTYQNFCNFFRNRRCHTLVAPTTDVNEEQNPQFLQQIIRFKKVLNGLPSINIDGNILSQVIQAYVSDMNQNLTASGIYRQGAECRVRIDCLSKLCKQLQQISHQQNIQKKAKMLKIALHEIQDNYISKMTSQKQIKILKQQVNIIMSQFEQINISTNHKNNDNRGQAIKDMRTKQARQSTTIGKPKLNNQAQIDIESLLNSEQQIRNINRIQISNNKKIRQELEAKIHRFQLEINQRQLGLKNIQNLNRQLQSERNWLEQENNKLKDQILIKQKQHTMSILELKQAIQQMKDQKFKIYSELEKQKQLLSQKNAFLQQKIAQLQINMMQLRSQTCSRYKRQLQYLENQNHQLINSHQKQIQNLRNIYAFPQNLAQDDLYSNTEQRNRYALNEQIRGYVQQLSKLQETISMLQLWKMQTQGKVYILQSQNQQLRKANTISFQSMDRNHKQKLQHMQLVHTAQMSNKDKLLQQLQLTYKEEKGMLKQELDGLIKKNDQQSLQYSESVIAYQNQIKKIEQQYMQVCQKYEIQQNLRMEKERQIKVMSEQIEVQRQQLSKNYNQHFEHMRTLRQELLTTKLELEKVLNQRQQINQMFQELQKQMLKHRQQYQNELKQRKSINEMQNKRLTNKISAQANIINTYKQVYNKYQQLQNVYNELLNRQKLQQVELKNKQECIDLLEDKCLMLQKQAQRMESTIDKLSQNIRHNTQQFHQFSEKNNQKIQQKQEEYRKVLDLYNNKERQCYLLNERLQTVKKQQQIKEKQLRKFINEKIQCKNKELNQLAKQMQSLNSTLNESQDQLLKTKHQLSLLAQRFEFMQQSNKVLSKDYQEKIEKSNKKYQSCKQRLQKQLKKLQQEKIGLLKTISILENDSRETCSGLVQMRRKYERNSQQYQSHIKFLTGKLIQLQAQDRVLRQQLQKTRRQLKSAQNTKQILETNYNQDFKVWCSKIQAFQSNSYKVSN